MEFNCEKGVAARGLVAAGQTGRGAFTFFNLAIAPAISRWGVCAVAALRMRLRATARCSDNDFGRDRHVRALSFPNMCDLLCGSVAERSADDKQTCHGSS